LIVEFLLVVAVLAALLAVAYALTPQPGESESFLGWWEQLFLYLLSFPTGSGLSADVGAERGAFQLVAAVGGLVLPALFVGAIVLKLFISPDLFTMRNRIAITPNVADDARGLEAGGHHLAVRGYSSTPFRLLNVTFSAILRFEQFDNDGTVLLVHRQLRVANPHYAIAHPHVPYTLSVPLDQSDWGDGASDALESIQGYRLSDATVLIVLVSGTVPELSTDFTEAHDFPLTRVLSRIPYAGLVVDFTRPVGDWEGWKDFDES
jgi:hypothetical protein